MKKDKMDFEEMHGAVSRALIKKNWTILEVLQAADAPEHLRSLERSLDHGLVRDIAHCGTD